MDLINADYWVGIPISYRSGPFSALLRVYHQSSHLGDEYLLREEVDDRVNLSYESVDLKLSYEFPKGIRIYAGAEHLFDRDPADLDKWAVQYGFEYESPWKFANNVLRPVLGANFKNWQETGWTTDISIRIGAQFENRRASGHKIQLLFEYFDGHSPNGQFFERQIEYVGFGPHFYF